MKLEENLIYLRKQNHLSQAEVAEALGVSRQSISRWECGTARPTTENLIALSQLYGADVVTLSGTGGRPEEEPKEEPREEPREEPAEEPREEPAGGLPALLEGTADQAPESRPDQGAKRRRVRPAALAAGLCAAFLAAGLLTATVFGPKVEEDVIPIEDLQQEPMELPIQSQFTILEE